MKIFDALRCNSSTRLAIVGAGGKTSAMFALARQYDRPVILSATAHLAIEQTKMADHHFVVENQEDINKIFSERISGVVLITGPENTQGRTIGLEEAVGLRLKAYVDQFNLPLIIEADGARGLPLKAPAEHEPPIPSWVNEVLVVAGLTGVGRYIDENSVFRPDRFANLAGQQLGDQVDLSGLVNYLIDHQGGLKNVPPKASKAILFNQYDSYSKQTPEENGLTTKLLTSYDQVLWGSMRSNGFLSGEVNFRYEKIAGIILAAGESSRFGHPKQLLTWQGKPFIRHVAERALAGGLDPVLVITGAIVEPIREALQGLPVQLINNRDWRDGQASSVRAGVEEVNTKAGAAIFLMSDIPQVPVELVRSLIQAHCQARVQIVAPRVQGRRANPVLFDRDCFFDLSNLTGNTGGRILFDEYPVTWIDWDNPFDVMDIDNPEEYDQFIKRIQG